MVGTVPSPSVDQLADLFGCTQQVARRVKDILNLSDSSGNLTNRILSYYAGYTVLRAVAYELGRAGIPSIVDAEAMRIPGVYNGSYWDDEVAVYVDRGNFHAKTLIFDVKKKRYIIMSYASFMNKTLKQLNRGRYYG